MHKLQDIVDKIFLEYLSRSLETLPKVLRSCLMNFLYLESILVLLAISEHNFFIVKHKLVIDLRV